LKSSEAYSERTQRKGKKMERKSAKWLEKLEKSKKGNRRFFAS